MISAEALEYGVLLDVLKEVGFVETEQREEAHILEFEFKQTPPAADIVLIRDGGVAQLPDTRRVR